MSDSITQAIPDQHIIQQLESFGLNPIESRIYLYLLGKQAKTMLELSRELSLPRTSIYDNSLKLIEKGLVEKVVTFKSQKLKAFPLSILQSVITREQEKIERLQEQLTQLTAQLAHVTQQPFATEVRYYQGQQGIRQMMWNSLCAKGETIGYSEFGRADVVGASYMEQWLKDMIQRKIGDRVLTNAEEEMLSYMTRHEKRDLRNQFQSTRVLPKKRLYISGDTTIYNNIFAVAYWKQGEIVGVEIENEEFVKTQKSLFEEMWKVAEPLKNYVRKL